MEDEGSLFVIDMNLFDAQSTSESLGRDHQTEKNFQKQKACWKPKVEDGEIWKSQQQLPLEIRFKPDGQTLLHAIEELYFVRKYAEAVDLADRSLKRTLDDALEKHILSYREKCLARQKLRC